MAELLARAHRLGLISQKRWIAMEKNRTALLPILSEQGSDDSVLIIAFSGGAQRLGVSVHEFFETTKTLGYNRILLRDPYFRHYHYGVDRARPDWPSLIAYLRAEVDRLQPKKILCVGSSSGGYAAIVAGHHLRADFVHAFGPQTEVVSRMTGGAPATRFDRWRFSKRGIYTEALDLAPMLAGYNGVSRYFIHYGTGNEKDRNAAMRITDMPGVTTLGYETDAHVIAVFLAKRKFLGQILVIENQHRLAELARRHFADKMRITSDEAVTTARKAQNADTSRSHRLTP
ncbi:MAG TPA: hypothetical protein VJQ55_03290 [Candidatus Binatia bacterium]|nr:hypothetical protein [Candidatus Binatia bacterium]